MESDLGTFSPLGLQFTGSDKARIIMKEVMKLLAPINVTSLEEHGEGTDINMWMTAGVPGQCYLEQNSVLFLALLLVTISKVRQHRKTVVTLYFGPF